MPDNKIKEPTLPITITSSMTNLFLRVAANIAQD